MPSSGLRFQTETLPAAEMSGVKFPWGTPILGMNPTPEQKRQVVRAKRKTDRAQQFIRSRNQTVALDRIAARVQDTINATARTELRKRRPRS